MGLTQSQQQCWENQQKLSEEMCELDFEDWALELFPSRRKIFSKALREVKMAHSGNDTN